MNLRSFVLWGALCSIGVGCKQPPLIDDSDGSSTSESGSTDESESGACPEGDLGCACYGNDTCNEGLECVEGVCAALECPDGTETCPCYGNGTCNDGLECSDGTCTPATGDGDADQCVACLEDNCPQYLSNCQADTGCECVLSCVLEGNLEGLCVNRCGFEDPPGLFGNLYACAWMMGCDEACWWVQTP